MFIWSKRNYIPIPEDISSVLSFIFYTARDIIICLLLLFGAVALFSILSILAGSRKIANELRRIGFVNHSGEVPILLSNRNHKKQCVHIMEFECIGIPLAEWEKRQSELQTALNGTIAQIKQGKTFRKTILYVIPNNAKKQKELFWNDTYLCKDIRINKSVERTKNRSGKSENKTLRIIGETKTKNSNRTIPLNARAKEALLFYKALQEKEGLQTDYVIATNTGQIVQNGAFQNMLNNMLKQLNIAHIGIHSLRHTFATNLIHSGVDVKVVSKLLDHASVSITYNTYVHTTMDDAILAVQALEKCS